MRARTVTLTAAQLPLAPDFNPGYPSPAPRLQPGIVSA